MSHQSVTWAYDQNIEPTGAKFVLVTLANYANQDGYCYPSQAKLATDTGQSERSVRAHLATLEERGILQREHRIGKHGHRTSDGFWLVGFKSQPAESAAEPPAKSAARNHVLPADPARPTGNYRQSLPADFAGSLKELNRQCEPSVEPLATDAPSRRERPRDIHWDTLTELHGFTPTEKTPEHGRWNRACAVWRALRASPDDMRLAYRLYVAAYKDAPVTAVGVSGRAEQLLNEHRNKQNGTSSNATTQRRDEEQRAAFAAAGLISPTNDERVRTATRSEHLPDVPGNHQPHRRVQGV